MLGDLGNRPATKLSPRFAQAREPRIAAAMDGLLRHVRDLIVELDLSQEDFRTVLRFLTRVGECCDERRQEWVLLADALGITGCVSEHEAALPAGTTPATLTGPFYRADAPRLDSGQSISLDGAGEPLHVRLQVVDLCGVPVRDAAVEIWHANAQGRYENQDPDRQPEHNLRGVFATDPAGAVAFETIRPAGYLIPSDGPVADLLRELGVGLRRPAHIQVRVSAPGIRTLVTHLFDRSDPAVGDDPLDAVRPELLVDIEPTGDTRGWRLEHRLVVARHAGAHAAANDETNRSLQNGKETSDGTA